MIYHTQRHPLDTQYFDSQFTRERARLTPIDKNILISMDQKQFEGFSYTNPNATLTWISPKRYFYELFFVCFSVFFKKAYWWFIFVTDLVALSLLLFHSSDSKKKLLLLCNNTRNCVSHVAWSSFFPYIDRSSSLLIILTKIYFIFCLNVFFCSFYDFFSSNLHFFIFSLSSLFLNNK